MPVDAGEVERIAALAKLELSEEDSKRFAAQFQQILDYFKQLEAVDTEDVEPTYHALQMEKLETPLRDDQIRESLPTEEVISGAPAAVENQFRVPKVIE